MGPQLGLLPIVSYNVLQTKSRSLCWELALSNNELTPTTWSGSLSTYSEASTAELAQNCRQENTHGGERRTSHGGACFELFRRAVVDRCQEAWTAVYVQYQNLVRHWVGGHAPDDDDLIQCAFEKFLHALNPETFARFSGVESLLAYLRRCARSVHIDRGRKACREQLWLEVWQEEHLSQPPGQEQAALDRITTEQCVQYILECLQDDQERLVVYLSFEIGLKPAEIARRHPAQFPTAHDVSRIKERIVGRLANDPALRAQYELL